MNTRKWDAIAVNIKTGKVRIFQSAISKENAEAVSKMAVMRRGVGEEFYTEVPTGMYKDGDVRTPSLEPD